MTESNSNKKYPRVGVGGLVVHEGSILLQLRTKPPEANCWNIPGGKVEWCETVEDALLRELSEEVGIEGEIVRLLCVTNHIVSADDAHWVSPAYLVRIKSGTARNLEPDFAKEIKWFPVESLPENQTQTARNAIAAFLDSISF